MLRELLVVRRDEVEHVAKGIRDYPVRCAEHVEKQHQVGGQCVVAHFEEVAHKAEYVPVATAIGATTGGCVCGEDVLHKSVINDGGRAGLGGVDRGTAFPNVQLFLDGHFQVPLVPCQHVPAHRHVVDSRKVLKLQDHFDLCLRQSLSAVVVSHGESLPCVRVHRCGEPRMLTRTIEMGKAEKVQ